MVVIARLLDVIKIFHRIDLVFCRILSQHICSKYSRLRRCTSLTSKARRTQRPK